MDEIRSGLLEVDCDVLVIGGGTAGPMTAYKAIRRNPNARATLLEKANVQRSGAITMGMDGLNTVVAGCATPEQYTQESPSQTTASAIALVTELRALNRIVSVAGCASVMGTSMQAGSIVRAGPSSYLGSIAEHGSFLLRYSRRRASSHG